MPCYSAPLFETPPESDGKFSPQTASCPLRLSANGAGA